MSNRLELVSYPTLAEQVEAMQRDGFVYVPSYLDANEIAELRRMSRQLEPIAENLEINLTVEKDSQVQKCINTVFNRDSLFLKYSDKPGMIELAEAVHRSDCRMMRMHTWLVGPGRPDQQLHADYQPYNLPADVLANPRVRMPIYSTTAHAYLVDMTEELGPTKLIPGSHLAGRKPNKGETTCNGAKERSFLGTAGDCIFFRIEIWHRGSANRTQEMRNTFMVHYANRMVAQKFPPYLSFKFNPAVVAAATPRQRRLLGVHPSDSYV